MLRRSLKSLRRKVVDKIGEQLTSVARDDDSKRDDVGASNETAMTTTGTDSLAEGAPEPPVVARLVVEVRSDGTRTVARGAMEDVMTGERVAVQAQGTTPAMLAASLAKSLFSAPMLARQAARAIQRNLREANNVPSNGESADRDESKDGKETK